jgi:hypothetical protein
MPRRHHCRWTDPPPPRSPSLHHHHARLTHEIYVEVAGPARRPREVRRELSRQHLPHHHLPRGEKRPSGAMHISYNVRKGSDRLVQAVSNWNNVTKYSTISSAVSNWYNVRLV